MTRYPPQGQPQGDYQGGESYGNQQPQYGSNEPNYGSYSSGENQGYGGNPSYGQPQHQYGEPQQDAAQGYYGTNEQAYQQYPNQSYSSYGEQQQNHASPPASYVAPHTQQPQYGASGQYPPPEYPPYAQQQHQQQYPMQQSYGPQGNDSDIQAFKSHYEQPHGPIDPTTGQPLPPGAEGDRGLMGALAGGAAGGYGGHKMGHGFLGGIGGAVAGSMLEDAYKKKNKKDKKEKKERFGRRGSNSSSSSSSSDSSDDEKKKRRNHAGGAAMAGNFFASSRDVRLEGRCTLVADCANGRGHHTTSYLDLNDCFTNSNGRLMWACGGNFAASSREVRLADGGQALEAELGDGRGGWQRNRVFLNERITNDGGRLQML